MYARPNGALDDAQIVCTSGCCELVHVVLLQRQRTYAPAIPYFKIYGTDVHVGFAS